VGGAGEHLAEGPSRTGNGVNEIGDEDEDENEEEEEAEEEAEADPPSSDFGAARDPFGASALFRYLVPRGGIIRRSRPSDYS
jgi:hypothetical protein